MSCSHAVVLRCVISHFLFIFNKVVSLLLTVVRVFNTCLSATHLGGSSLFLVYHSHSAEWVLIVLVFFKTTAWNFSVLSVIYYCCWWGWVSILIDVLMSCFGMASFSSRFPLLLNEVDLSQPCFYIVTHQPHFYVWSGFLSFCLPFLLTGWLIILSVFSVTFIEVIFGCPRYFTAAHWGGSA